MGTKILISTGGTGGHVYPAVSLAKELEKKFSLKPLFVGGELSSNRWFEKDLFEYQDISSSTLSLKQGLKLFTSGFKILKGVFESFFLIQKYKPTLIVAFGSFHTLPVLIAAFIMRKPVYLHEQNKAMGRVNRLFAWWAKKVLVTFPETSPKVKRAKHVLMPLKFKSEDICEKGEAKKTLGLNLNLKTILVCGGSQGALSVNQYFLDSLKYLEEFSFQVIHLTGTNENIDRVIECYREAKVPAIVRAFDENIHLLMRASDFLISRAGASSIAEMIELELPAILIPYPYANAHQEYNADFMESVVKGGLKISESSLNGLLLAKAIVSFFNDENIAQHRHHIKKYKQKTELQSCSEVLSLDLNLHEKK